MMNILALSLVVSSLAVAGKWSPTPQREDVRVKEGHRVTVVEYDEDGKHNTKVSISSPPPPQKQPKPAEYFGKEAIKEAASVLPNLGQGISPKGKAGTGRHFPGELICDAFGKCTQTIAAVFGKAKDKVSETAEEAQEYVKDKVEEISQQTKVAIGDALGKAKEAVAQKGQDLKKSAKESIDKAKDTVETAKDTAKTIRDHIVNNVTEKVKKAWENAMKEEKKEQFAATARKAKTSANKLFDGVNYMSTIKALNPVMGIANLVGLASAYGMSVWVTFISSNVLADVLPRQQFGVVQSKINPVYFKAMGSSVGLTLLGHFLGQRKTLFSSKPEMFQAFNLLSSFFLVLVNALYFEPKATKVMLERTKMEKEEGRGRDSFVVEESWAREAATKSRESQSSAATIAEQEVVKSKIARLNEMLKKLNARSSLLHVLTLMALTWHLVYLGHRLSFNCC